MEKEASENDAALLQREKERIIREQEERGWRAWEKEEYAKAQSEQDTDMLKFFK